MGLAPPVEWEDAIDPVQKPGMHGRQRLTHELVRSSRSLLMSQLSRGQEYKCQANDQVKLRIKAAQSADRILSKDEHTGENMSQKELRLLKTPLIVSSKGPAKPVYHAASQQYIYPETGRPVTKVLKSIF
jgi:hypothetical protein